MIIDGKFVTLLSETQLLIDSPLWWQNFVNYARANHSDVDDLLSVYECIFVYNIIHGRNGLVFSREIDATAFILKWS